MQTTTEKEQADATATDKKTILFVDDEPNFLNGIRRMLRPYRDIWEMVFVNSVDEALAKVQVIEFDTIVSDVNMPVKSGLDLLAGLSELEGARTVPVIILTGNAETDLKRKALDLGATDLLNKPVGQDDLVARLQSVLRLKSYQDQLRDQNEILERRVRERTADLEFARLDIIWRLAKAGEFRDEETGDHVMRVALCCRALADALGLNRDHVREIFLASPLHDLGKIGIPDSVLLKPGKLEPEERALMEKHCEIGASILSAQPKNIASMLDGGNDIEGAKDPDHLRETAATIIMSHHEKWDGSGYPNKLVGEDIPIEGLICAVADVYDALRAERPYKKAFTIEKTMDCMRSGRGSHFAPDVFDAFERVQSEFEDIRTEFAD